MKALWHGVPMLLVPWRRDQPGVAARAEHLGVAVVIGRDALGPAALSEAAERVRTNPAYPSGECLGHATRRLRSEERRVGKECRL